MPHISVIIPTYNRLEFVQKAIQSVYGQTYSDFELIIIDDGSRDGTEEALKKTALPQTQYLRQENRGVSAARNRGITRATGEWICFLDSDDHWLEKKLARQIDYHKKHPDIVVSQTGEIWIRHGKRVNQMKKHHKPTGDIYEKCLEMCCVTPSSVMIHRSVFDTVGLFDEALPACEDYDLWLRISCRYKIGLLPEDLIVKYGGHTDQLSRCVPALDRYRIKALRAMLKGTLLNEGQRQATIQEIKRKCSIYAGGCVKRGKHSEAEYYTTIGDSF